MKFILKGHQEDTGLGTKRWVFIFPASFSIKRVGADYDQGTGVLSLFADSDGCKVIDEYKGSRKGKRVQMSSKKWLPKLHQQEVQGEVEWVSGGCALKVQEPVRYIDPRKVEPTKLGMSDYTSGKIDMILSVDDSPQEEFVHDTYQPNNPPLWYGADMAEEESHKEPRITSDSHASEVVLALNKYVEANPSLEFVVEFGGLKIKKTVTTYL